MRRQTGRQSTAHLNSIVRRLNGPRSRNACLVCRSDRQCIRLARCCSRRHGPLGSRRVSLEPAICLLLRSQGTSCLPPSCFMGDAHPASARAPLSAGPLRSGRERSQHRKFLGLPGGSCPLCFASAPVDQAMASNHSFKVTRRPVTQLAAASWAPVHRAPQLNR